MTPDQSVIRRDDYWLTLEVDLSAIDAGEEPPGRIELRIKGDSIGSGLQMTPVQARQIAGELLRAADIARDWYG